MCFANNFSQFVAFFFLTFLEIFIFSLWIMIFWAVVSGIQLSSNFLLQRLNHNNWPLASETFLICRVRWEAHTCWANIAYGKDPEPMDVWDVDLGKISHDLCNYTSLESTCTMRETEQTPICKT